MNQNLPKPVRVVLLAAGQGKRMKSSRPKVLHEVLGRSILSRMLDALDELNPEHIHIVVGHGADEVCAFLRTHPPKSNWSTQLQEPQLGTGHALMQVTPELAAFSGTLLVSVGDTPLLTAHSLRTFIEKHRSYKAQLSLLTTHVQDPRNYGRIIRNTQDKIVRIIEDQDATDEEKKICEINPAIYCLEWPELAAGLSQLTNNNKQGEYYLTDLVSWASSNNIPISSMVAPDWREVTGINSRLELAEAARLMRDNVVAKLALECGVTVVDPESTWIAPEVKIGEDTVIYPHCYLVGQVEIAHFCSIGPMTVINGPVHIGPNTRVFQSLVVNSEIGADCQVGPFAHLRDKAKIADHCRIGNYVEIKGSSVGWSTTIKHLSYVGDAVLGTQVNIGAGTIIANYDHLRHKKSRTIINDGASTGSNSVLVAPVIIGSESVVAAGTVVTKDVPEGALAVGRARQENREEWAKKRKNSFKPPVNNA